MSDAEQVIPPHGCWQCKVEFDSLGREETVGFWQAFAELWIHESEEAQELAIKMAEEWVDNKFAEEHKFHKPESWIG